MTHWSEMPLVEWEGVAPDYPADHHMHDYMADTYRWGVRPAGTRPRALDRTPAQLSTVRDQTLGLWTTACDIYISAMLGYTEAVLDISRLSGLDHLYVQSLIEWVMDSQFPDVVDLYEDDAASDLPLQGED